MQEGFTQEATQKQVLKDKQAFGWAEKWTIRTLHRANNMSAVICVDHRSQITEETGWTALWLQTSKLRLGEVADSQSGHQAPSSQPCGSELGLPGS